MARSVKALVKPDLLVWARLDIGLSIDDMAGKLRVKPERIIDWESGADQPTVAQLRKYAQVCRRPLAVFYLPEPPTTFQAMRDFRRMAGSVSADYSRELHVALREATARRHVALDLWADSDAEPLSFALTAQLSDPVAITAQRVRQALGITWKQQVAWKDHYEALNAWRNAIEKSGVLVFQVSGVSTDEMRGFSITDDPLPVIAMNSQDHPHARIFSMLHELVHIMLRQGGLCDFNDSIGLPPEKQRIEVYCNAVAGEILVPENQLLRSETVIAHGSATEWAMNELDTLGKQFSVSKEVVARRLLAAGKTTHEHYRAWRQSFAAGGHETKSSGGPPYYKRVIANLGEPYIRLVLHNYYTDKITLSDVSRYLDMKLQHLSKVERQVFGEAVEV